MLKEPDFKVSMTGASVALAKKKIEISPEDDIAVLNLTNEYGNSLRYELNVNQFDSLHSALWQFVKERQH